MVESLAIDGVPHRTLDFSTLPQPAALRIELARDWPRMAAIAENKTARVEAKTFRALACLVFTVGWLNACGNFTLAADGGPTTTLRPRPSATESIGPTARAASPTAVKSPWDDDPSDGSGGSQRAGGGRLAVNRAQSATYNEPASDSAQSGSNALGAGREAGALALPPPTAGPSQRGSTPLTLAPPRSQPDTDRAQRSLPSLATLLGGLGVVVGLFLLAAWLLRLGLPKGAPTLPREAWEVLGRAPLAGRQHVQLVRCGGKMLLLSVTPGSAETLTEITDPAEVDRLAGICQQARPNSATANFRQLLDGFASDPQPSPRRVRDFDRVTLSGEDVALG